jgi:hypothetical protein
METPAQDPDGSAAEYEFDDKQNKVIADLANSMRWVAAPLLVLGLLYIVASAFCVIQAFRHPATIVSVIYVGLIALLFLALGRWTGDAAKSFLEVVSTRGRDISHLMDALENLRKKYSLLSVFVKIYVVLIILSLIAAAIIAITGWMRA